MVSGRAGIQWLRREEVLAELRRLARRMAREHPEIERVILFGSMARGDAGPWSDADLLLVLRESPLPFPERISRYAVPFRVPVQVFPYTREELTLMGDNPFIRKALSGITLYPEEEDA